METDLAGRVVMVTGAARGIGAATARRFAGEGAKVVVNYNTSREQAERLVAGLPDAVALQADISQEGDVDALFAMAVDRYGSVDVCVCNAAIYSPPAPAVDIDAERFRRIVDTNLTGTFLVARAFLRQVKRQGSGNLILVGSTAGIFGEEGQADYAATKAALTGGLLPTLKNEIARLAPRGRVNAVCPGWTETEMAARGPLGAGTARADHANDAAAQGRPARRRRLADRRPRLGPALGPCLGPGGRGGRRHGGPAPPRDVKHWCLMPMFHA